MTVHRTHPPTRAMRDNPDIDQLKRQARELLEAYRAQSPDAIIEVAAHHRTATPETFALHDAQFVLARSYGFESWPKLKAAVDGVTTTRLHEAVQKGDLGAVRALLARRPEIVDLLREGYNGGSPRTHAPDQAMIDLMLEHGGWIDASAVGYIRNVELARRMLQGEIDPHPASGTFSGEKVAEQILWGGASGRSAEIVRMALERIDWPRDDPRWFWLLWRPLPGHRDLDEVEQADSRATFRLILDRCDPNLQAPESGQTMLHEVIARDHGVGVALATILLDAGARTDIRDEFLKSTSLGWACRWGRLPLVELLLARGADPIEPGPSHGPHRSRGPNGVNMRRLHRSSGNTELSADSCDANFGVCLNELDSVAHRFEESAAQAWPPLFVPANGFSQFVGRGLTELEPLHRPRISFSIRRFRSDQGSSRMVPCSTASIRRSISRSHAASASGSAGPSKLANSSAASSARVAGSRRNASAKTDR